MSERDDDRDPARERQRELRDFIAAANVAAVSLSAATLKALLLLNGGAAIAMLGFVASLSSGRPQERLDLERVVEALQAYAVGAALAVMATGLAYAVMFMQASVVGSYDLTDEAPFYANSPATALRSRIYEFLHIAAVLVALGSLIAFGIGVAWIGEIVAMAERAK